MKGGKGKSKCMCGFLLTRTMGQLKSIMTSTAVMMVPIRKLLFRRMEGDEKNHIRNLCIVASAKYVNKRSGLHCWEES